MMTAKRDLIGTSGPGGDLILGIEDETLAITLKAAGATHFIIGIGSLAADRSQPRRDCFGRALALGLMAHSVVHPKAIVAGDAMIGAGTFVAAGAIIGPSVRIGRSCFGIDERIL